LTFCPATDGLVNLFTTKQTSIQAKTNHTTFALLQLLSVCNPLSSMQLTITCLCHQTTITT